MSSFDRRSLILAPLALAACGFQPVYGPDGAGSRLYGRIKTEVPANQESYLLTRELQQRLGRAQIADYRLQTSPRVSQEGQAVTATGEVTRFSIVGTAEFTLTALSDDSVVAQGMVENFTGYSATGTTIETLAAEEDALERLMSILADQITAQIYALADIPG